MMSQGKILSISFGMLLQFPVFGSLCPLLSAAHSVKYDEHNMDYPIGDNQDVDYRIGEEDELDISVYGNSDLSKTQTVRPGGKITLPLIGDIKASGLTPDELRERITQELLKYVTDPRVTVIVTRYNSKKISLLGEVKAPGILRLSSDIKLLEAISRAGGITEDADLQGGLVVRNRQLLPVNFETLFRKGDLSQDILLQPNDLVLIPSVKDKKVFVLGQVTKPSAVPLRSGLTLIESISRAEGITESADLQGSLLVREGRIMPVDFDKLLRKGDTSQNMLLRSQDVILIPDVKDRKVSVLGEVTRPLVVVLKPGVTLVESISMAGGFTQGAQAKNVLLIRGALGNPNIQKINVHDITNKGDVSQNVILQPGDIVYVPRTLVADVTKYFQSIATVLTPVVLARTGIVFAPGLQPNVSGSK